MDNVYVLHVEDRLVGVYTSHRKAIQAMLEHNLSNSFVLTEYAFEFDIEFYTFQDGHGHKSNWNLQEVTPDE